MPQFHNPLLDIKYDEVYMYDYEPVYTKFYTEGGLEAQTGGLIVGENGKLTPQESIKNTALLDKKTAQELLLLLGNPNSYWTEAMRCFMPHVGFVYFFEKQIIFHASICLTCNNLSMNISAPGHNLTQGMKNSVRNFLNDLLDKFNFSNNIRYEVDDTYDKEEYLRTTRESLKAQDTQS